MPRFERRDFGGRGRSFGPSEDLPKPVNVGEEYDVEIAEVGSKGDGIARVKNFVVFVNGTQKGEKVRIKIKEVMSRFATGEKVGAAEAAPAAEQAVEATKEPAEAVEEATKEVVAAEEEAPEETDEPEEAEEEE